MELKINKETIRSEQRVCSVTQEQSVELDYVLPDYCPEIFRIIRCTASPAVTSSAVCGDKLSYELTVDINVIYCSKENDTLHCASQQLTFSRTAALESIVTSPDVQIRAETDYMNCRAVNPRRIDVRGAVTMKITVSGSVETEAVCDAFGGSIQLRKNSVMCPVSVIKCSKRCTVSDEFSLPDDKPPMTSVLRAKADNISCEAKVISNKVAAKGELKVNLLYSPTADSYSGAKAETMQFTLPYSCLCDMDGIDERHQCRIVTRVLSCTITPKSDDGDGEVRLFECEVLLHLECTAVRYAHVDIADDEYSTAFETEHTSAKIMIPSEPSEIRTVLTAKAVITFSDSPAAVIYDAWLNTDKLVPTLRDGHLCFEGIVTAYILGENEEGDIICCENEAAVETDMGGLSFSDTADLDMTIDTTNISYTLSPDGNAEIKAELTANGYVTEYSEFEVITDITASNTPITASEAALRLYFAEEGEQLWDIAKRYRACVTAVAEENDLEYGSLTGRKMLLIPSAQ